jgi:hypothetical protein
MRPGRGGRRRPRAVRRSAARKIRKIPENRKNCDSSLGVFCASAPFADGDILGAAIIDLEMRAIFSLAAHADDHRVIPRAASPGPRAFPRPARARRGRAAVPPADRVGPRSERRSRFGPAAPGGALA